MLAAGGYGKRELFPYATVDILVLLEGESPWVSLREPLAECVRLLWDAGLRLNHTVRTVSECLEFREQNIDLDINLLDLRYLAGDQALYSRFENKWPAFLEKNGPKLGQHLAQHTRVRHAKFQNTVHHREPDIKEAPGGLRDWNLIGWLARLDAGEAHVSDDSTATQTQSGRRVPLRGAMLFALSSPERPQSVGCGSAGANAGATVQPRPNDSRPSANHWFPNGCANTSGTPG